MGFRGLLSYIRYGQSNLGRVSRSWVIKYWEDELGNYPMQKIEAHDLFEYLQHNCPFEVMNREHAGKVTLYMLFYASQGDVCDACRALSRREYVQFIDSV